MRTSHLNGPRPATSSRSCSAFCILQSRRSRAVPSLRVGRIRGLAQLRGTLGDLPWARLRERAPTGSQFRDPVLPSALCNRGAAAPSLAVPFEAAFGRPFFVREAVRLGGLFLLCAGDHHASRLPPAVTWVTGRRRRSECIANQFGDPPFHVINHQLQLGVRVLPEFDKLGVRIDGVRGVVTRFVQFSELPVDNR